MDFRDRNEQVQAGTGIGYADLQILDCAAGSGSLLRTGDWSLAAA